MALEDAERMELFNSIFINNDTAETLRTGALGIIKRLIKYIG